MTRKAGKLKANKPIGNGQDERPHGTRWKTGLRGVINADIVREFASNGIGFEVIGFLCGCTRQNIYNVLRRDEDLMQAWSEGIACYIARCSYNVADNVDDGNLLASMFGLKCVHLPNEKGWIEQQYREKTVDIDSLPKVTIFLPENHRNSTENDSDDESFSVNNGLSN